MDHPVVDLSHWNVANEAIPFAAIKADGVVGCIHKVTQGSDYLDPTFHERREKYAARRISAEAVGLLWGAYHFLEPGDMREQAEWFVLNVGEGPYLLAADHEDPAVSLEDLKSFLRVCYDLTGQKPCVYSGHVIKEQLGGANDEFLGSHRLWLAQYTTGNPSWPDHTWSTWWLHQFTDQGTVAGFSPVDLNHFVGDDIDQLIEEWLGYA